MQSRLYCSSGGTMFLVGALFGSSTPNVTNNYVNRSMRRNGTEGPGSNSTDPADANSLPGYILDLNSMNEAWWKTTPTATTAGANWSSAWGTSTAAPWQWDADTYTPRLWFEFL